MRKSVLITILVFTSAMILCAPNVEHTLYVKKAPAINPYEKLFTACARVESENNPNAINKKEQAYGIVQIRQIRLDDFNQRTGKHYKLKDMLDTKRSKEVFMYYAKSYGINHIETIARRWNGSGKETLVYWNKVKQHIK